MSDAAGSDERRVSILRALRDALEHASVDELWRTLDEVDWLISTLESEDRAERAILRSFAELIAAEARRHDRDLDLALEMLLDLPTDLPTDQPTDPR